MWTILFYVVDLAGMALVGIMFWQLARVLW